MKKALKHFIGSYFQFSGGERIAIYVVIIVTIVISLLPVFVFKNQHAEQTDFSLIKNLSDADSIRDSQYVKLHNEEDQFQEYPERRIQSVKFLFNPNDASRSQLISLGFKKFLAERIIKFRAAGGKFYVKSDISKIYGVSPGFVQELMPYIDLPETREKQNQSPEKSVSETKKSAIALLDINIADTNELKKLPGIGSKLSQRIIAFREKLGGYYSLDQLYEVYGLKPEVIEMIRPKLLADIHPFKLLDINSVIVEELSRHPYIKKNLAEIIINYRTQHGAFSTVNELLNIKVLDEKTFLRIKNYLKS